MVGELLKGSENFYRAQWASEKLRELLKSSNNFCGIQITFGQLAKLLTSFIRSNIMSFP